MNKEEILNDLYARIEERGSVERPDGEAIQELGLTDFEIPEDVNIGDFAFAGCNTLENVTIPDGVSFIGSAAFENCNNLTNIVIPDSVEEIGSYAFSHCTSLTSVIILDGVTGIGSNAFWKCNSLSSIVIPNSVSEIGAMAFSDCNNLETLTIPSSVVLIGFAAFNNCSKLKELVFQGKTKEEIQAMEYYPWKIKNPEEVIISRNESSPSSIEESLIKKWRKLYLKSI